MNAPYSEINKAKFSFGEVSKQSKHFERFSELTRYIDKENVRCSYVL